VLKLARAGDPRPLDGLMAAVRHGERAFSATQLSQGLHASTLCADTAAPWGGPDAPLADRAERLRSAALGLDLWPLGSATATGNGIARTCLYWPPTRVALPRVAADLPPVPVLLLAGTKDLSTPLEWAREERAHAPRGRLMIVPGAGHSVQTQRVPAVRRAVARFLQQ
jgi:pimeloyl-ACP methyl ester carboxylesterase